MKSRKSNLLRLLSLITLSAVFMTCVLTIRKEASTYSAQNRTNLINSIQQYLNDKISYPAEYVKVNKEATFSALDTAASDVLDYVNANNNSFTEHFSGVYIKSGTLMISVTDYQDSYPILLKDFINEVDYQFVEVTYSKSELDLIASEINHSIGSLNDKKIKGELYGDVQYLMEHYPRCNYPWQLNRIIISFKAEENSEEFKKLVSLFEQYIGSYEGIIFEADPDYQPASLYSTNLLSGSELVVFAFDSTLYLSKSSIGYRAHYDTRSGYVFSGHAVSQEGCKVALTTTYSSNIIIGSVRGRSFQNNSDVDVAFFSVDNPSFIPTNRIASLNSQGQVITMGANYRSAAPGNTIYKDGKSSHLTSATVSSSNSSSYFSNGYYLFGLLETANNAQEGDSGGPAFILDTSTTGKVVGIVTGGSNNKTYYTQAACINYMFGATVY